MPAVIVTGTIYYLMWYFLTGLPLGSAAGYTFLMVMIYEVYEMTLGLVVIAFSPDLKAAGLMLVFIVTLFNWFNGVVVPYDQIQVFWRYWVRLQFELNFKSKDRSPANNQIIVAVLHQPFDLPIRRHDHRRQRKRPRGMRSKRPLFVPAPIGTVLSRIRRRLGATSVGQPHQSHVYTALPCLRAHFRQPVSCQVQSS